MINPVPLREASKRTGVPLSTLYRWVRLGILESEKRYLPFSPAGPRTVRCVYLTDVERVDMARSAVSSDPAARR